MDNWFLRINGRGNAWPVPIGQVHPFYSHSGKHEYENASFSLMRFNHESKTRNHLEYELMIDAGHGSIPFLLNSYNRIPDALFITHPHFDHILGIDWIAQSYYRFHNKQRYPLYATENCWQTILKTIPHLRELIDFHPLEFGINTEIHGLNNVHVTAFPVYHGNSAGGSAMFLFEIENDLDSLSRVLFIGDVLLPLLNERAYEKLSNVNYLVVDANNRFPYPKSNHWSISKGEGQGTKFLNDFMQKLDIDSVFEPFVSFSDYAYLPEYFESLKAQLKNKNDLCLTVFDLVQKINPEMTLPVHYSGQEDKTYYNKSILNSMDLQNWLNNTSNKLSFTTTFVVSEIGDFFPV